MEDSVPLSTVLPGIEWIKRIYMIFKLLYLNNSKIVALQRRYTSPFAITLLEK